MSVVIDRSIKSPFSHIWNGNDAFALVNKQNEGKGFPFAQYALLHIQLLNDVVLRVYLGGFGTSSTDFNELGNLADSHPSSSISEPSPKLYSILTWHHIRSEVSLTALMADYATTGFCRQKITTTGPSYMQLIPGNVKTA